MEGQKEKVGNRIPLKRVLARKRIVASRTFKRSRLEVYLLHCQRDLSSTYR